VVVGPADDVGGMEYELCGDCADSAMDMYAGHQESMEYEELERRYKI
jgi:hypothetical protein